MTKPHDLIILGSGPAGLTAAIYASRAHLNTLILGGQPPGGQLVRTTTVENYPGFPQGILGPQLIANMRAQAQRFGTQITDVNVTQVNFTQSPFILKTNRNQELRARSVIIATGASAKWLGLPSEEKLKGKGVSACATCDGFFFKNKVVAVIGGGDTAIEEALFLTKFARQIYLVHRRDQLRASKIMQKKVLHHPKIKLIWNNQVQEILGQDKVTGLQLANTQTHQRSTLPVDGVFIAIGHRPNTQFLKNSLNLDPKGYIRVTDFTHTSVPGIFAAGDVIDPRYRQAVTAAGSGCMAALDTEKWLSEQS